MKNNKKEIMHRRKEHRLRELQAVVDQYAKLYNIDEEIKIKEISGPDVNKLKDRVGLVHCVELEKGYLKINKGLLEVDFIPQLVMQRLIAIEMAHLHYKDNLLLNMKKDFLFLRRLKFSHLKGIINVLTELRADISATEVMGLSTTEEIEISNMYSGFDFFKCYKEQGYPDKELRINICNKYDKFTRKTIEEVFYLYKRKLTQMGYKFNITIEDLDKFVETLPVEWGENWPLTDNIDEDIQEVQDIVRELNN